MASVLRRAATCLLPLGLAACQPGVLDPQGPIGAADRTILIDSLAIMLAIVIPTIAVTCGVAWWFRRSNTKARYLPDWEYSGQIELIVWSIPLLTITLLGGVAWIGAHQLDPSERIRSVSPGLEVQAVSLDWKWLFIYPDRQIASVNELVVPAGVPLHFSLTSASVMNAFFVPRLGSMIYTMNGMATELSLQADQPGEFAGLSAHYSGDGFSDMHFQVRAVPAEQFDAWVSDTRKAGPTLDMAAYAKLAEQSVAVKPFSYHAVEDGLFQKVVTQEAPPAPGPQVGDEGAPVTTRPGH